MPTGTRGAGDKTPSRTGWKLFAALLTVLAMALAGCSDDGGSGGGDAGEPGASAKDSVSTDAAIGKVSGRLAAPAREKLVTRVGAVIDGWIDGAYGGDYPRSDFDAAFADFTPGARKLAVKQPRVMSNDSVGADISGVRISARSLRLDVVAPKGKVAGATARVRITLEMSGERDTTEQVVGRLMLTPTKGGWKVFGFDVSRGERGA